MSKASELREQNDEQLSFSLKQTQKDYFQLQFQSATEKLDTPSRMKELRREIARIKTIQREREIQNGQATT
ncbi:50S ribosomal protein L29 [Rubinisphaera margarita]|uniref:50S ribosomal protein L29 n=1 Tax=Rubinisphaera margarita TaxID=2909586 RepID=UPI001EE921D2|nr:50S ribosomal protein L29 [Rubinisphaera margarita]MCG6154957.1 50S ribosomal protein L29 [Rubinisphaera margarita]